MYLSHLLHRNFMNIWNKIMDDLLVHSLTAIFIGKRLESEHHAILMYGAEGSGKYTLSRELLRLKLGLNNQQVLDNHPYVMHIYPDNDVISIEAIRNLQQFLTLKTTGQNAIRRGIIIENAHTMTAEAQNALLKSLEEPPTDTIIVLTAITGLHLKKTIYSRVQSLAVLPVSIIETKDYFIKQGVSDKDINKAYAISRGHVGLMAALLQGDKQHALLIQIDKAKKLMASPVFDRLALVDELSKAREDLPQLLYSCALLCRTALNAAATQNNTKRVSNLAATLKKIHQSQAALVYNPNQKLLLTDLVLAM